MQVVQYWERKKGRKEGKRKEGRKEEGIIWFLLFVPRRQTFGFVVVPIFFKLFITFIYSTLRDF